jgi:3',5'-cyclic AMP phosphodiesterase CpdA
MALPFGVLRVYDPLHSQAAELRMTSQFQSDPVAATERNHRDYVTIVHLSDLHFPSPSVRSRIGFNPDFNNGTSANVAALVAQICGHKPDLICVTGDIADNPDDWALFRRARFVATATSVFSSARQVLRHLCGEANASTGAKLLVIPGNHDLRVQGIYGIQRTRKRLKQAFDAVFESHLCYEPQVITYLANARLPMTVRILGIDSNTHENFLNAASGTVTDQGLQRIKQLSPDESSGGVQNPAEFRVCLVHHHPLPVAGAEKSPKSGFFSSVLSTLKGEQMAVFRRAGSFLLNARNAHVDLVLHGHQHHSQMSILNTPVTAAPDYPMLIVGAGSFGEETDSKWRYNVIRLYRNGDIAVDEIERAQNATYTPNKNMAMLFRDDRARYAQAEWMLHNLRRTNRDQFGIASVTQCIRRISILSDGSADYDIELFGLKATSESVATVPIITPVAAHAVMNSAEAFVLNAAVGERTSVQVEPVEAGDADTPWQLRFTPPLTRDSNLALRVRYSIDNHFDFIAEYAKNRSSDVAADGEYVTSRNWEYTDYKSQRVTMGSLIISVSLPLSLALAESPRAVVLDQDEQLDPMEGGYAARALYVGKSENCVAMTLTVNKPLPGYQYRIEWPMWAKVDYEAAMYDRALLEQASAHAATEDDDQCVSAVSELLRQLHVDYLGLQANNLTARPSFPGNVALSVFLARCDVERFETERVANAFLSRIATWPVSTERSCEWPAGEGLIGKAHRAAAMQYAQADDGMRGYFRQEGKDAHTAMWAIPLHVHGERVPPSRSPIYAVLCIDTRDVMSNRRSLNSDHDAMKGMIETFNKALISALVAARVRQ